MFRIDPAIQAFFQERKEAWLKKNSKATMGAEALAAKEQEACERFSLAQWLPDAAKRAGQISLSTHPCTFSHPSARKNKNGSASAIIARSTFQADGFLRSGNVSVETDALGNAAALDVYKFLSLTLADGETLLAHLNRDSEQAKQLLNLKTHSYEALKADFLAMTQSDAESVTSAKIKQVYFPTPEGYHLLSLLTASGLVFALRKRIDELRFSDTTKAARKAKKEGAHHPEGYKDINQITTIAYGGTKPQNISVLNNQNGGRAYLLLCAPPELKKRSVVFPSTDFFRQAISPFACRSHFLALHDLFLNHRNNWQHRAERDDFYQAIIHHIIEALWRVRAVAAEQYNPQRSRLPQEQIVWLCEHTAEQREQEDEWLVVITQAVAQFIFNSYEKMLGKRAFVFSDSEFTHIHTLVEQSREALR